MVASEQVPAAAGEEARTWQYTAAAARPSTTLRRARSDSHLIHDAAAAAGTARPCDSDLVSCGGGGGYGPSGNSTGDGYYDGIGRVPLENDWDGGDRGRGGSGWQRDPESPFRESLGSHLVYLQRMSELMQALTAATTAASAAVVAATAAASSAADAGGIAAAAAEPPVATGCFTRDGAAFAEGSAAAGSATGAGIAGTGSTTHRERGTQVEVVRRGILKKPSVERQRRMEAAAAAPTAPKVVGALPVVMTDSAGVRRLARSRSAEAGGDGAGLQRGGTALWAGSLDGAGSERALR
ncbi:hypothetical protein HK405_006266 [Cladochytrium tenue]|nr:hypothetical protein HK405_006266 [Cladochytrium tenue]